MRELDGAWRNRTACLLAMTMLCIVACGTANSPFDPYDPTIPADRITVSPSDGGTSISVQTLVTVSFPSTLLIDPNTIHGGNLILQERLSGLRVSSDVSYDNSLRVALLRPLQNLAGKRQYTMAVQGVRTSDGTLFQTKVSSFTTGDAPTVQAPEVVATVPIDTQDYVSVASPVTIVFSEAMNRPSCEQAFQISNGATGQFSWNAESTRMTFTPRNDLLWGTRYDVTIQTSATDTSGNPLNLTHRFWFRTVPLGAFSVVSSVPEQDDPPVTAPANVTIAFNFSEPVDPTTITTNFTIGSTPAQIAVADGQFAFSPDYQVVTYTPPSFLEDPPRYFSAGTTVGVTLSGDIFSTTRIPLGTPFSLFFTIETDPPQVTQAVPANGATQVPADQEIRWTFNEPLLPSTVNVANFTVSQAVVLAPAAGYPRTTDNGRVIVWRPAVDFSNTPTPVVVTANTGLTDLGGTPLAIPVSASFTIDNLGPTFSFVTPANGSTEIPVTTTSPMMVFEFNEALDQAATEATFTITPPGGMGDGTLSWSSASRLVYTTGSLLPGDTQFTASLTATDLAGNATVLNVTWRTDSTGPDVDIVVPADGTTAVATNQNVVVTFSERMNRTSVRNAFELSFGTTTWTQADGTMSFTETGTPAQTVLTFVPTASYDLDTTVTVRIASTATDLGGNTLSSFSSTFVTTDI